MTVITAKNMSAEVQRVFEGCLIREDEIPEDDRTPYRHMHVGGVVHHFALQPDRIDQHRAEIEALLARLPMAFRPTEEGGGGGWSFLEACNDIDGEQWTGLHLIMEQLFVLGIAIDRVTCQVPREMWPVMPGGMPYYMVKLT